MSCKQFFTIVITLSFAAGTWIATGLLSNQTMPVPVAHAQATLPSVVPKLPAAPAPPPEIQELQKNPPPPQGAQRPRPTVQQLLDVLRRQPGGQQLIDDAKRGGARISMKQDQPNSPLFSWSDLFGVSRAEAQGTFMFTLTPATPIHPDGSFNIHGAYYFAPYSIGLPHSMVASIGAAVVRPFVNFALNAPVTGYYLINIDGMSVNSILSLKHYVATSSGGSNQTVQTWDYRAMATGRYDFPALVYLTAGSHWFKWVNEGGGTFYFYAIDVSFLGILVR